MHKSINKDENKEKINMIAIVVVGYNRADSMKMLLDSISNAEYDGDEVELVVSVDKGNTQTDVVNVAQKFDWKFGKKILRVYEEKQGLRKHILQCGDLTKKYDAVIVLEDDLIVSPAFYRYAKNAIDFYDGDYRIAGISLYSYHVNEFCNKIFQPSYNGYDTYVMQVAQSWGQCWTKRMWKEFRNWKYCDAEMIPLGNNMPKNVYEWGKSSWKKNYMAYIVSTNKFFVYPYQSYSTNRSEVGTHRKLSTTDFQVQLVEGQMDWRLAPVDSSIKYDIFFERLNMESYIEELNDKKICMDLYGMKTNYQNSDFLFSTRKLPYKIVKEIGLVYRPMEVNCIQPVPGKGLYLYDLHTTAQIPKDKNNEFLLYEYQFPGLNWHFSFKYVNYRILEAIKSRLERMLKYR